MKYNKNTDTFLYQRLFTMGKREKNIEKTLFLSAGAQKRWKTEGSGNTLPRDLPNPKSRFLVKFIFTYIYIKYICLTFNWQKS